jgi:hypothetical protein
MLAKVFTCAVEASFHRGNTGIESLGNLGVAAAFLDERKEGAILRPQLRQSVTQGIEFLGIHRPRRFGNVFVLLPEGQKNSAQLLPPQLIDAGVPRQTKQPRFKLRRRLQAIDGANHFDEHLLRQVLDVITSAGHGVNETGNPMLVADNELPLGDLVALLGPPNKIGQRIR